MDKFLFYWIDRNPQSTLVLKEGLEFSINPLYNFNHNTVVLLAVEKTRLEDYFIKLSNVLYRSKKDIGSNLIYHVGTNFRNKFELEEKLMQFERGFKMPISYLNEQNMQRVIAKYKKFLPSD